MWQFSTKALICFVYFDGLVQDCSNSTANAVELLQSYTEPSILKLYVFPVPVVYRIMLVYLPCLALQCQSCQITLDISRNIQGNDSTAMYVLEPVCMYKVMCRFIL